MAANEEVIASIETKLASWDRQSVDQRVAEAEALRAEFVHEFPMDAWATMPLERYGLGQPTNTHSLCWWLEFNTRRIASMSGGSAHKHLIFYSKSKSRWVYPKEYGSVDEAWAAIRAGFVEAFESASTGSFSAADDVRALLGAAALRTKALYMYFPDQLVPVCSKDHIDRFLLALGEQPQGGSTVAANRHLLQALRRIQPLAPLSTQQLGYFLYHWKDPRNAVNVWKIAPGHSAKYWEDCLAGGYICVGWDDVGDLSEFESKKEFLNRFREHYPYNQHEPQVVRKSNEVWTLMDLEPGDRIVANRGTTQVLAVGTVNDTGYQWRGDRQEYRHTRGVDWDTSFAKEIPAVRSWATTTVAKVREPLWRTITSGAGQSAEPVKPVQVDQVYRDIESAMQRRGQVVLYGPPGTGKTFHARRAAAWLLAGGSQSNDANALLGADGIPPTVTGGESHDGVGRVEVVTFHPSYGYEDFIEGYRPTAGGSGGLELTLQDGIFKRLCTTAAKDPANRYLLIIDEINRGNIPKIFGELITIIEKDKRGMTVRLPQSGRSFSVPPNVGIIGTMNTADRSIHLLDVALRRRFAFVELLPDSDVLDGATVGPLALDVFLDSLNERVTKRVGREKQVGHAMFFADGKVIDSPDAFALMVKHELVPLLQEYLYEDYRELAEILGPVVDAEAQTLTGLIDEPERLCAELADFLAAAATT